MKKIKVINRFICTKLLAVIFIMSIALNGFAQARSMIGPVPKNN